MSNSKNGEYFSKTTNLRWHAPKQYPNQFILQQMHQASKGTVIWENIPYVVD